MKKMEHDERVALAKSRITKSISKNTRKLTLRQKRLATLIGSATLAVGASAGIAAGVAIEATKDRTVAYPMLNERVRASDFIYKPDAKPRVSTEMVGSQIVSRAQMGPVNFISNYSRMMNQEKLEDWLKWFYHDVSWGPEISTLSNISFLSGVQADDGIVTIGYHTTSRDSSTVVLSPDVNFTMTAPNHFADAVAYYMLNNKEHGYELAKNFFPGLEGTDAAHPSKTMAYKELSSNKYAIHKTEQVQPFNFKKEICDELFANAFTRQTVQYAPSGSLALRPQFLPTPYIQTGTVTQYWFWDFYQKAVENWSVATWAEKLTILRVMGLDVTVKGNTIQYLLTNDNGSAFDEAKIDALFNHFINTKFFRSLANNHKFNLNRVYTPEELKDGSKKGYTDFINNKDNKTIILKLMSIQLQAVEDTNRYHMSALTKYYQYGQDPKEMKKALDEGIGLSNPWQYSEKNKKISAILSTLNLFLMNNQISSSLPGVKPLGHQIMLDVFKELSASSNVDKLATGEFLWKYVNPNGDYIKNKSGISAADLSKIKDNMKFSSDSLLMFSKHLDAKYHSGQVINGTRYPGIPVYKPGDTMYDAYVRRASQDIMYTASHEYGHHTTMFHAQDISAYNGLSSVGENKDASEASHPAVVRNAEVLSSPNLAALASGEKYGIFRDAFKTSPYFQDILDRSTDGDSRTDIVVQMYRDQMYIDYRDTIKEEPIQAFEDGIEQFNNFVNNRLLEVEPMYVGPTFNGLGESRITPDLLSIIRNIKANHQFTKDEVSKDVSLMTNAFGILAQLKSNNTDFFDVAENKTIDDKRFGFPKGLEDEVGYVPQTAPDASYIDANNKTMGLKNFIKTRIEKPSYWYEGENTILKSTTGAKNYALPFLASIATFMTNPNDPLKLNEKITLAQKEIILRAYHYIYGVKTGGIDNLTNNPSVDNPNIKTSLETWKSTNYNDYLVLIHVFQSLNEQINTLNSILYTNVDGTAKGEPFLEPAGSIESEFFRVYERYRANVEDDNMVNGSTTTPLDIAGFINKYFTAANIELKSDSTDATIKHWELKSSNGITSLTEYNALSSNEYLWDQVDKTQRWLKDTSQNSEAINSLTTEPFVRGIYEDAGQNTKKLFDGLFSRNTSYNNTLMNMSNPLSGSLNINMQFGDTIGDKFLIWNIFINHFEKAISESRSQSQLINRLLSTAVGGNPAPSTWITVELSGVKWALRLDNKFINDIIKPMFGPSSKHGATFLTMRGGAKSPEAVIYVFNKENDKADYKTVFTTAASGTVPPKSFIRYSSYYAESLTRSLNQIGYSQYPELSSILGEYLDGDRSRFKSYRLTFYNNIKTGNTLDQSITTTGQEVVDMFGKYFGMDRELSSIVKNYQSGLYSFIGYSDTKNKYRALVFTDSNGNIVNQARMTYGVSNHHYYSDFAHPESRVSMEDHMHRYSWMTEFAPLGDWANTLLKPGDYHIKFWEDKNNNNQIDEGELVKLLNEQVTGNGQLNENGKSDNIAQVVGNPDHKEQIDGDKLKEEFMFRISDILI